MVGEEALAGRRSHASGSGVACLLFLPIVAACQAGFPEATVRRNNVRVTEQRHGQLCVQALQLFHLRKQLRRGKLARIAVSPTSGAAVSLMAGRGPNCLALLHAARIAK